MDRMEFAVPCLFGLEGIAADELKRLDIENVRAENGRVLFSGDDWKGTERFLATEKSFQDAGIPLEMVFFSYTQGVSTSQIKKDMQK